MNDALPRPSPRFLRLLGLAVVLGVAVRLVALVYYRSLHLPFAGDPWVYYWEGRGLAEGRGWVNPIALRGFDVHRQIAMHPPTYPLWLAGWSAVGLSSVFWAQIANIVLGLCAIVVIGLTGREIAGNRVGVVAAFIVAVHPSFWTWEPMLVQEPAAILACSIALLAAVRLVRHLSLRRAVVAGLCFGIAPLTRAELLLAVLLFGGVLAIKYRMKVVRPLLVVAIVAGIVVLPWSIYNSSRFSRAVPLSNGLGATMAATYCDAVQGDQLGYWSLSCAFDRGQQAFDEWHAAHPDAPRLEVSSSLCRDGRLDFSNPAAALLARSGMDEVEMCTNPESIAESGLAYLFYPDFDDAELDARLREISLQWAADHPRAVIESVAARVGRVLGVYHPAQQIRFDTVPESRPRRFAILAWTAYYLLLPFAVVGGRLLWVRGRRSAVLILCAPIVTSLVAVALTFGNTRYRAIAEPSMAIFVAVSGLALFDHVRRRQLRSRGTTL